MQNKESGILSIETSCDETAISVLMGTNIVAHHVHSQASLHAQYGGVFPNVAKREHVKNIVPLLSICFHTAYNLPIYQYAPAITNDQPQKESECETVNELLSQEKLAKARELLSREEGLFDNLCAYIENIGESGIQTIRQNIGAVAVTYGPGLEPALWVGISTAKALSVLLDIPLYPINHMEGHIASVLKSTITVPADNPAKTDSTDKLQIDSGDTTPDTSTPIRFPAIALLISGGHTELVHIASWHAYQIIGRTKDDAVGEAYDKVARMLGLPYPGGPEISKLAYLYRNNQLSTESAQENIYTLPRPMMYTKDFDFSFSGLKTAVLYTAKKLSETKDTITLSTDQKYALAYEFEESVKDVLLFKTKKAIETHSAQSLIIGGGVIANTYIREHMKILADNLDIDIYIPDMDMTTDNASMIGLVATLQIQSGKIGLLYSDNPIEFDALKAEGNLDLGSNLK